MGRMGDWAGDKEIRKDKLGDNSWFVPGIFFWFILMWPNWRIFPATDVQYHGQDFQIYLRFQLKYYQKYLNGIVKTCKLYMFQFFFKFILIFYLRWPQHAFIFFSGLLGRQCSPTHRSALGYSSEFPGGELLESLFYLASN